MSVRVFCSATVANIACGFDVLGLAVEEPGDEIEASISPVNGVRLVHIDGDHGQLPREPEKNAAGAPALALLAALGESRGVDLKIKKQCPAASGLGSSSASAAGAAFAVNLLFGSPFSPLELIPFALEGERAASGSAHPDNVTPALLGGITLIRSTVPLDVVQLPVPPELWVSLCHPHLELRTRDARTVLRDSVQLADAVRQLGNIGSFVSALFREDYALLGRSLEDRFAEGPRSVLIPGFSSVKSAALSAGALGCSISGAGPSLFALCRGASTARAAAAAMQSAFTGIGVPSDIFVSPINVRGPRVL